MKTDETEQILAGHWSGPVLANDATAIEPGKSVACIATTYTFDAAFFEVDLLPRFLGLKFDNTEREASFLIEREQALGTARACVLVDHTCVDAKQTTLRWDQIPVRVPGGVQHAKIVVLVWERRLRLMVSSANLTKTGYRTNREVAGVFDFFDSDQSAPLQLAKDALGFLRDLAESTWVQGNEGARSRFTASMELARVRLQRWKNAPGDFTPRELPRVTFVGGRPAYVGRRMLSVIGQTGELWGARRATEVAVMTPFSGETEAGMGRLIGRLKDMSRSSSASTSTFLAIPGRDAEEKGKKISGLPRFFRDVWNSSWGDVQDGPSIFVIPLRRPGEKINRALHAKALSWSDGERDLLLCGSSNFTPHGMGDGVANVEANVCYQEISQARVRLDTRLPVRWSGEKNDLCEDVFWPTDVESPVDERASQPFVPEVFKAISYDQKHGTLTVFFDSGHLFPSAWSLALSGDVDAVLLDSVRVPTVPTEGFIAVEVPETQRGLVLTCVRVSWMNEEGQRQSGWIAVQTESLDNLLPPEEFRGLSSENIMNCLISGREPAELVGDDDDETAQVFKKKERSGAYDPLREIDTTGYTLYQLRKLGQTLAALAERLEKSICTTEAVSYRLRYDALGPIALADALAKDLDPAKANFDAAQMRTSQLAFSLTEISLALAHACRRVHAGRNSGDHDVRPVYAEVIQELLARSSQPGNSSGDAGPLGYYFDAVKTKCLELVGAGNEAHGD
jgi:hypothetical protein